MKYKLINKTTGEETLCDKVTIDGYDYYVSDEKPVKSTKPCYCYNSIKNTWDDDIVFYQGVMPMYHYEGFKIVIATNNPNIDIAKVVDEVEELAKNHLEKIYNDKNKADEYLKANDAFTAKMFTSFIVGYNKSQETHPYSDEDMIEFADWEASSKEASDFWRKNRINLKMEGSQNKHKELLKELLQIWKEQKPKTLYYE